MLGDINKLFVFKSLLMTPSNVLPLHLKETFQHIVQILTEGGGDGIESILPFKKLLLVLTLKRATFEAYFFTVAS